MKFSKRRGFGMVLIGTAFITWLVLVCFLYRGRVLESHSYSDSRSSFSFMVTAQSVRWPAWLRVGLISVGVLGIILLVTPDGRSVRPNSNSSKSPH